MLLSTKVVLTVAAIECVVSSTVAVKTSNFKPNLKQKPTYIWLTIFDFPVMVCFHVGP